MLPQPRVKLKGVTNKNQSLQDILATCTVGVEVLHVQPVRNAAHNTRLVIRIDKGKFYPGKHRFEDRVQFYDRIRIEDFIPVWFKPKDTIEDTIHHLNVFYECDFELDDLEFVNGRLEAKRTSLGFYSDRPDDDQSLMWDADETKPMWSLFETDYMWLKSDQFPENEEMVGDQVTERQFKEGLVELMDSVKNKIDMSLLGTPNGVATLDATGKINIDQVPITVYFNEPNW